MGRHSGAGGSRRGAHRSEPENTSALASVGHVLESTVPKRVDPPRLLTVLLISGVTLALTLFGYSTTQIYLRFSDPPAGHEASPGTGQSERLDQPDARPSASATPEGDGEPRSATENAPAADDPEPSTVTYRLVEATDTTFTGAVTVTNTGDSTLRGWELALGFSDATVTSAWDADWETTSSGLIARPSDGQGGLAPGASVTVHFIAEGSAQSPTSCSLNGHFCDL
ncbi:hypothetical protein CDO52_08770 [Nocardiopsis gilva YIM 90087]|uniref:CBM2 domain-containing protein n=1 Tax=Nocardiopsis gilva YIM 90087 TaxID=1235441 RepID=A0A223S416_9ACTN|nr:cellulose binding domain-containing protein [Nocardiopsis gilva]ASU82865.1 hypothetical protein CDO52_08770 [Nocardiopsis gilva YIM 90087]